LSRLQIWPVYSQGPPEQKPVINFGEKRAWAYSGTAQSFKVHPISSGMGKLLTHSWTNRKLRTPNFVRTFMRSITTKAH